MGSGLCWRGIRLSSCGSRPGELSLVLSCPCPSGRSLGPGSSSGFDPRGVHPWLPRLQRVSHYPWPRWGLVRGWQDQGCPTPLLPSPACHQGGTWGQAGSRVLPACLWSDSDSERLCRTGLQLAAGLLGEVQTSYRFPWDTLFVWSPSLNHTSFSLASCTPPPSQRPSAHHWLSELISKARKFKLRTRNELTISTVFIHEKTMMVLYFYFLGITTISWTWVYLKFNYFKHCYNWMKVILVTSNSWTLNKL